MQYTNQKTQTVGSGGKRIPQLIMGIIIPKMAVREGMERVRISFFPSFAPIASCFLSENHVDITIISSKTVK